MTPSRKLLSPREAEREYQIRGLAHRRVRGNGPPFIKVGKLVFYEPSAVEAWLKQNTYSSTSEYAA